jgi:hypothetical protein
MIASHPHGNKPTDAPPSHELRPLAAPFEKPVTWLRSAGKRIAVLASVALTITAGPGAPAAHADADPASDFLLAAPVFYPYQPTTSPAVKSALEGALAELKRKGLDLKVAIIDPPNDLGAVTNLWRMPQPYADFLGREISFNQRQPLLVVMPPGFGVYDVNGQAALNGLAIDRSHQADGLARSAITALVRLARANGKPIGQPAIPKEASSGKGTPALIVFGAPVLLVALAALIALTRRTHGDIEADREDGEHDGPEPNGVG